mgnify:CR=1 FL=1
MQIACPNCNARYLVPDAKIGREGRRVRCARCETMWKTEGISPAPAPDVNDAPKESVAAEAPPEEPMLAAPHLDPPNRMKPVQVDPVPRDRSPVPIADRPRCRWMGWAALVILVMALLAAFVLASDQIKTVWPASAKIYEVIGVSNDPKPAMASDMAPDPPDPAMRKAPEASAEKPALDTGGLESSKLTHAWVSSAAGGYDLKVTGEVTNKASSERPDAYMRVRLLDKQGGIVRDKRELVGGGPFAPGETRSFTIIFSDPGEKVAKAIPAIEPAR